jgi:hypothetical protein
MLFFNMVCLTVGLAFGDEVHIVEDEAGDVGAKVLDGEEAHVEELEVKGVGKFHDQGDNVRK